MLKFLFTRLLSIPVSLLFVTAVLYGIAMATPPQVRGLLYLTQTERTKGDVFALVGRAVDKYGLDDPYPVQYLRWVGNMLRGDWSWSPTLREDVLPALVRRTAVTAELTLYSVLVFIPCGLIAGVLAGGLRNRPADYGFRAAAFLATAVPSFVMALLLLAVFYTGRHWFPPERLSTAYNQVVNAATFRHYTGLLTLDGLLNGRPDLSLDAAQHLVLPVITLAAAQWATLGRVTRISMVDELQKEYATAGRARGLSRGRLWWRHVFPNAAAPVLASSAVSTAALLTGVFIVEIIFSLHGVSEVIAFWSRAPVNALLVPDVAAVLGFAVYSVLIVQALMLLFDLLQMVLNPRLRPEGDAA